MNKKIVCETCGAEFDASLVRCPYCGTAYAPAEEEEYMEKLEGVRTELHQEIDKGNKRIGRELGNTFRVILAAVIVILLLVIGGVWLSGKTERSREEQKNEEFLQNMGITTQEEGQDR